jgi:hypothetical protein
MLLTKTVVVVLLTLVTITGLASGRQIHVQNRLGYRVWVGILGNPGKGQPDNGGFALNNRERVSKGLEFWVWNLLCQREEILLRLLGKQGAEGSIWT